MGGFIGGSGENQSLELLGRIAEDCSVAGGVPLIAEMLPQSPDHLPIQNLFLWV